MKKFGKIIIAMLVLACLVGACFALVACDPTEELVVATNCEFEPFEYLDDNGNPTGIDMDIAAALAEELGLKLKVNDMAFDSVVASVASGTCDIAMAGLTVTEERKKSVDFTQTYFSSSQVVIAKTGDPILDIVVNDLEDEDEVAAQVAEVEAALNGKRVGVQNGTTGYSYVSGDSDNYDGVAGATAVGYTSGALAVQAMLNGQVDYVIIDKVPAEKLIASNEGTALSNVVLTGEDYAFAVKKGDTEFLAKVNAALEKLIADGTIEAIFQRYGYTSGLGA